MRFTVSIYLTAVTTLKKRPESETESAASVSSPARSAKKMRMDSPDAFADDQDGYGVLGLDYYG
jgi:hypothetical protein